MMELKVQKINKKARLPKYQTKGASGFDLHSVEDAIIDRGCVTTIATGLKVAIPEGYELQIRPRSGLSLETKLRVANSPGTVDSDYRGELKIIMHNTGNKAEQIQVGDRVAQAVVVPVVQCELIEVDELDETERGEKGIGSTGKN